MKYKKLPFKKWKLFTRVIMYRLTKEQILKHSKKGISFSEKSK